MHVSTFHIISKETLLSMSRQPLSVYLMVLLSDSDKDVVVKFPRIFQNVNRLLSPHFVGTWTGLPLPYFPQMTEGRHYHHITTLGLIPTVFGGWNNGSLASIERIDYCSKSRPEWKETKDYLLVAREHFASVKVPPDFYKDCAEGGEEEEDE